MSKAPFMPLFCDAYLGDTMHLSLEEHGAYLKLLMITWRGSGSPIADDAPRIARMLGITVDRWTKKLRPVLVSFFDLSRGTWRQIRLEKEWEQSLNFIESRRENGRQGGRPKALKIKDDDKALGSTQDNLPESPLSLSLSLLDRKEEIPTVSPRNRGTRWVGVVCEEWVAETEGIRLKAKLGPVDGEAQAALFADFWVAKAGQAGVKLDWHATWRNWIRNARGGNGHDNGRQHRLSPVEGIYKGWDTLIRGIEGEDNRDIDWQPAVPLLGRGGA